MSMSKHPCSAVSDRTLQTTVVSRRAVLGAMGAVAAMPVLAPDTWDRHRNIVAAAGFKAEE